MVHGKIRSFLRMQDAPGLCAGVFCLVMGLTALFSNTQVRGRVMMLLSLCLLIWGIVCCRSALKNGEAMAHVLRALCFVFFGSVMLFANLAGVMFSSRVLGTMLFLYGTVPIALFFAEKSSDAPRMFHSIIYVVLGCLLVLFSGQKGILPAASVVICGICIVQSAFHIPYNFRVVGDAKDNRT